MTVLNYLKACRPKEVSQHLERTLPAVKASNKEQLVAAARKADGGFVRFGTCTCEESYQRNEKLSLTY